MDPFTYEALPQRVVFGSGTLAKVGDELDRLDVRRALAITTAGHAAAGRQLADQLGARCVGTFAGAVMHTPIDVTMKAMERLREIEVDALVTLGGGSTIGLGKALALRTRMPHVAIPTTYAGSEATPILGETAGGRKTTRRDLAVLPAVIVYDVNLTVSLPVDLTVTSGLNAMAHAVEALYAKDRNPVVSLFAERGLAALARALPDITRNPGDRDARRDALFGAWLCGTCLGTVGMALHHKICHTLGGSFGLPHAATHAVVLPHAIAYNERAASAELLPVARLFGAATAADGVWTFAQSLGAPMTLAALGMKQTDLDRAVALMLESPYWNPRPLVAADLRALLDNAFFGRRPAGRRV